jgi:hypothetical protein
MIGKVPTFKTTWSSIWVDAILGWIVTTIKCAEWTIDSIEPIVETSTYITYVKSA